MGAALGVVRGTEGPPADRGTDYGSATSEGDFDASQFKDRYDEALREMIKAKAKGGKGVVDIAEPDDTNVIDLMAALKNSLKGGGGDKKPAAKKAPAKKPAAKKKSAA